MAYDFHGKWERETGHNAPLYAPSSDSEWRKQLSVDHAAHLWVKLGAPKEKLIIGKLLICSISFPSFSLFCQKIFSIRSTIKKYVLFLR